jgi:hypothetical protein
MTPSRTFDSIRTKLGVRLADDLYKRITAVNLSDQGQLAVTRRYLSHGRGKSSIAFVRHSGNPAPPLRIR